MRKSIGNCYWCKRRNSAVGKQLMADIPLCRLQFDHPAFFNVGVDYFGPLSVKQGRSTVKKYGCIFTCLTIRGGVEDTRLEAKAKAKDTKKIRGQGQGQRQPFRGQTLSRPRTGMLEAKAKDQGHKAQVLSKKKKKKGLHKNFSSDLKKKKKKKKKVFTKIFQAISTKKRFPKIFQPLHKILTFQKIVLSSSRGQANFRGLEASRPRPRT